MPGLDLQLFLERDRESLGLIIDGLERLKQQWREAQVAVQARNRGYFTPDEDDWVRQILLAYRNYRIGLYEIIHHYQGYQSIESREAQLSGFLLALAAALILYSNSLLLIQTYEREPLIRKKLNEPDSKFDLEGDFFDTVLGAYSSLRNFRALMKGLRFWRTNRRDIQRLTASPDWAWVANLVQTQRRLVRNRFFNVLLSRMRYDWSEFLKTTFRPVHNTRYSLQSLIGGACAGICLNNRYVPALSSAILGQVYPLLRPGDVLLVRTEQKLTSALLPGFWAHAALYIGRRDDLQRLKVTTHPHVAKNLSAVDEQSRISGCVIEAISPRVLVNQLEHSLHADHVTVLRPNLSTDQIASGITDAFGHVGKPYDFEFDFNVTSRVVCTEIIYRAYHKRGPIQFPLVKRLGRFTLSADDIAAIVVNGLTQNNQRAQIPFEPIALALKDGTEARFVPAPEAAKALAQIQQGWRPGKP